jgi:hypothetical protein
MWKRKRALLLAVCLLLATALVALLARDSEPHYQGRSLSKWLVVYRNYSGSREAEQAIRTIGTNALPYLLQWIRQEPPFWRQAMFRVLPKPISQRVYNLIIMPGYDRAARATWAFGILGTNAASAIPELTTMIHDPTRPNTAGRAIVALSSLGPPAFPHMTAALSNTNHPYRGQIAFFLGELMVHRVGTNACLPPLTAVLNDPDPGVRTIALQELHYLTNAPGQ